MNIGTISAFSKIYKNVPNEQLVRPDSNQGFFQSLNLEANKIINLGSINGKPLDMKIFQNGGFEWSGSPRIFAHSGSQVTPEDAAAAYAASSLYTKNEYEQGSHISAVINRIYLVANKVMTTNSFNELIINANISQEEIDQALNRLGFDSSEPFTVNNRTFVFKDGILKDY